MLQVIRSRRSGKTTELILYAMRYGYAIATSNYASKKNIENIAKCLGIVGLEVIVPISSKRGGEREIVFDDIDIRMQWYMKSNGYDLKGYSLSLLDSDANPRNNTDEVQ